jgi:hypothetical protein
MLIARTLRLVIDLASGLMVVLLILFRSPYREQYLEFKYQAFDDTSILMGIVCSLLFLLLRGIHALLTKKLLGKHITYRDIFFAGFFGFSLCYWLYFSWSDAAVHMT